MIKRSLGKITYKNKKGVLLDDGISILEISTNVVHNSLTDWIKVIELREKGVLVEKEGLEDMVFSMDDDVLDEVSYFFS